MTFSYSKKITLLYCCLVIGIIYGGRTTYINSQFTKATESKIQHVHEILLESENVLSLSQDIVLSTRGYVITGDSSYLSPYILAIEEMEHAIASLQQLVYETPLQLQTDSLNILIRKRIEISKRIIQLRRQEGFDAAQELVKTNEGKQVMDEIRILSTRIKNEGNRTLEEYLEISLQNNLTFSISLYLLLTFTLALLILILFIIRRNIKQEGKMKQFAILEAKSKEMEQFTYIASHDLRHPLLTILNYIKIFDEDYADKLDEEAKHCLRSISGAANRMDKLILGLLDYSRLSKINKLEKIDCNEIIQTVIADLNSTVLSTKAKIIVNDLPQINGYPIELRQLFQNLITNALKFRKIGTIPELTVSVKKDKEGYCFEFRDNGIGIKAKDIEKLFLIFQRLHTTEEYEGTGLGLAYCKKIVELHRGQIWVESKPDQGSSFYFTINT